MTEAHHDRHSITVFGFWVYLLSDFMMFAALFATYAVLRNSTYGGPSAQELFSLPSTLVQTLILLTCSFTSGLGGVTAYRNQKNWTIVLFSLTFLLGAFFLTMELFEFSRLIQAGNHWQGSAFLSAFFTLVGTHLLHVIFGLLWTIVLVLPVCFSGITAQSLTRLTCLRMFWQFVNVIWVFVFFFVYLMGGFNAQ